MVLQLRLRPVDHADEAFEALLQQPRAQRAIALQIAQEAWHAAIMAEALVAFS